VQVSAIYHRRDNRMGTVMSFDPNDFGMPIPMDPVEVKQYMGQRETEMFKAELSVPIYTFGLNEALYRQAQHNLAATSYQALSTKQTVIRNAKRAYSDLVRMIKLHAAASKRLEAVKKHREQIEAFFKQGLVVKADVLALDVAVAQAESGLLSAEQGVRIATMALASAIGVSLDSNLQITGVLPIFEVRENVDFLIQQALKMSPQLRQMNHSLSALKEALNAVKAQRYPMLFASGAYNWSSDETQIHKDYWSTDIILSWNAFSGLSITADERNLKHKIEALKEQQLYAAEMLKLGVRSAFLAYENAKKSYEVAQRQFETASERMRIVEAQFSAGTVTSTQLIDAQTELFVSESNLAIAQTEIFNALTELELVVSIPLSKRK
ncbi:MAG: TolC family protein, partial [Planctomycetota bacterium]|nr:TolC family protein [Planctomycetota bacterium]